MGTQNDTERKARLWMVYAVVIAIVVIFASVIAL